MVDDCVFCKIVRGELSSDKVFESDDFVVIRDVNPKVDGHLLVVSKRHYGSFMEMDEELYGKALIVAKKVCEREGIGDFNLVVNQGKIAGQVVEHFHLHILPRREGDGFRVGV